LSANGHDKFSVKRARLPSDCAGHRPADDKIADAGIAEELSQARSGADSEALPTLDLKKTLSTWPERGVWERLFSSLATIPDLSDRLFLDSTCIKVHRCAGGAKGGPGSWYPPDV